MKHAAIVTSVATTSKLSDLLGQSDVNTDGITLQLLTGTVSVGNRSDQPFPLAVATPLSLSNQRNTEGVYLIGAGTVAVGLF